LHPVFHPNLLEPYTSPSIISNRPDAPAPRITLDDTDDYVTPVIDQILDCRKIGRRFEYFVHWKSSTIADRSWTPLSDIPVSDNPLLEKFHRRHRSHP
ncbi:hypothetical protein SISNIDRAFT_395437, partial [Sistotremastrum niveocremeum HHB9708]